MCEVYEIRRPFGVLLLGGRVSGFGRPSEGRDADGICGSWITTSPGAGEVG